jgi:hypothetical protein
MSAELTPPSRAEKLAHFDGRDINVDVDAVQEQAI